MHFLNLGVCQKDADFLSKENRWGLRAITHVSALKIEIYPLLVEYKGNRIRRKVCIRYREAFQTL